MKSILLSILAAAALAACGGGDCDESGDEFAQQAERVCAEHRGVRSYSVAEWRDREGNPAVVLASVHCMDGLVRSASPINH